MKECTSPRAVDTKVDSLVHAPPTRKEIKTEPVVSAAVCCDVCTLSVNVIEVGIVKDS